MAFKRKKAKDVETKVESVARAVTEARAAALPATKGLSNPKPQPGIFHSRGVVRKVLPAA